MTQLTQSRLVTQEAAGDAVVVRLRPGMQGEIRVALATARMEEHDNRDQALLRAPEAQPGEWTVTRLMLEWLERDGEINFYEFSLNEPKAYNEFGKVSSEYYLAVEHFRRHVELSQA